MTQTLDLDTPRLSLEDLGEPPSGVIVENIRPQVDGGRYPAKRVVGDTLTVSADIFREGHDELAAILRYRTRKQADWTEVPMVHAGNDRWEGSFPLTENTRYYYNVLAFPDPFASWVHEVQKKLEARLDVASELLEGLRLVSDIEARATEPDKSTVATALAAARRQRDQSLAVATLTSGPTRSAIDRHRPRTGSTTNPVDLPLTVDRPRARFAAWYEFFPRSAGEIPGQSGTFADAVRHLPRIAAMGFDTVYFPPIHPIGTINRKGRNNTLRALPGDPGSPYAIGSAAGGHDAIEPSLGTVNDFRAFVEAARKYDMDVILDFAINAAPDHPWVKDHPDWFYRRPDGTIKYAENPPKKYEDIYPLNFFSNEWRAISQEMLRVITFWVENGVRGFRVDNPHTKPTAFWEWLIETVQRDHPEVIFLSEAFTRPKVMKSLAKAGFTQSYTYFTWRNFKDELIDYLTELTQTEMVEYFRGNFFPSTPDILPYFLQEGGRPAHRIRLVLAATLSSVYGIYSPFELCENAAVPGKEEYLNSEKYELKVWDWDRPGRISDDMTLINTIRKTHPALQLYDNLRFYPANDPNMLCYGKQTAEHRDIIVCLVNLDPFAAHDTWFELPLRDFGIGPDEPYRVREYFSEQEFMWTGAHHHWYLDPQTQPAAIFSLRSWKSIHHDEPCG